MSGDNLKGTIVESVQNKEFSENVQRIGAVYSEIDAYIKNLENDAYSIEQYRDKLLVLKKRGFKVTNAIAKLDYQCKTLRQKIENLNAQKVNNLVLFNNDLYELTRQVLEYRLVIDDKDDGVVQKYKDGLKEFHDVTSTHFDAVNRLAISSMNHMQDLKDDVYKFDPQIQEAIGYKERNFDVGDLVETLELQKQTTREKYDTYSGFYSSISRKHMLRTEEYMQDLIAESKKVQEAIQKNQEVEEEPTADPTTRNELEVNSPVMDSEDQLE